MWKNMIKNRKHHIYSFVNLIAFFAISFLFSCVGTIKSANPINTVTITNSTAVLNNFQGIALANPIADSKVEIFFYPIAENVDNYSYIINYDGKQVPIYVPANSLITDYRGYVKYTVTGLLANTSYTFNVQIRDITLSKESSNNVKLTATTFSNFTANFYGISEVRNLPGASGLNGISVIWPEAEVKGGNTPVEIDPIEYRVTVLDATNHVPGDINDTSYGEPSRKVISAAKDKRNIVINGLLSGTKYYVQVRAIHKGAIDNSANSNYKTEANTNYLEITTYSADQSQAAPDSNLFSLSLPPGVGGLYSIIANWKIPTGNFDHFRLYYAKAGNNLANFVTSSGITKNSTCELPEVNNSNIRCLAIDSNLATGSITGLSPISDYDVLLAACIDTACTRKATTSVQTKKTSPNSASFNGIKTIASANDVNELNTLTLNFDLPNFNTGNISGYNIDYYFNSISYLSPVTLNDPANTTSITVDSFNYLTDTSIKLRGIDYNSTDLQCFAIYPYSYDGSGNKVVQKQNLTPKCILPAATAPDSTQFLGFKDPGLSCSSGSRSIALNWDTPTGGVYDKYEIFYVKVSSISDPFNIDFAYDYANHPEYHRILLDNSKTSYIISNLQSGAGIYYKVGISTFYDVPNNVQNSIPIRSDMTMLGCDFN
jgi:hypothetical protein